MNDAAYPATIDRPVAPAERFFTRSPFSIVTVVARIKGHVSETMLRNAVDRLRLRHANLRVRIIEDEQHAPWFTSEGAEEIAVASEPRDSDEQWLDVLERESRIPFAFDRRPAIRFVLLESDVRSDVVILCHHILCDGLSLAYLVRDLMVHLADPSREADALPDPIPIDLDTLPAEARPNALARALIGRMNRTWRRSPVFFDQQDYLDLSAAYWDRIHARTLAAELSEDETSALVDRCRRERVTVNSALTAALIDAQIFVQGIGANPSLLAIAANLRDRLPIDPGQAMGFYAGAARFKHRPDPRVDFWENARRLHRRATPLLRGRPVLRAPATWCLLDPAILEAMNFKKLGGLVSADAPRHRKLAAFARRPDVVRRLLRHEGMDCLDRISLGASVTNLGRLEFQRRYGDLELDRLLFQPGGAFPLTQVGLVLGAATCSSKLTLTLESAERRADAAVLHDVLARTLALLHSDD